jgi:uncharacterized membrane protein
MAQRLYVAFDDRGQAEKAAGALLDYGIRKEDVSVVIDHAGDDAINPDAAGLERAAKVGISTTTADDAGAGAAKGAGVGLGVGVLAGLAALFVPGVGLVYGAGALATAIAGAVGTTAAGAVAGGVTGYLKDQGVPEAVVHGYTGRLQNGGALLELVLPSGKVDEPTGREIAAKYGGVDVNTY